MMKQKTKNIIKIDEKIKKAKEVVAKAKIRYDKSLSCLKELLDKREEIRQKEIMNAIANSKRSYDEILKFIKS